MMPKHGSIEPVLSKGPILTSPGILGRRIEERRRNGPDSVMVAVAQAQGGYSESVFVRKRVALYQDLAVIDAKVTARAHDRASRIESGDVDARSMNYRENYEEVQKILAKHGGEYAKHVSGHFRKNPETGEPEFQSEFEREQSGAGTESTQIHHLTNIGSQRDLPGFEQAENAGSPHGLVEVTRDVHTDHFHSGNTKPPTSFEGSVPHEQADDIAEHFGDQAWVSAIPARLIASAVFGALRGGWLHRRAGREALLCTAAWSAGWAGLASGTGAVVQYGLRNVGARPWHMRLIEGPDASGHIAADPRDALAEGWGDHGAEFLGYSVTRIGFRMTGNVRRFAQGQLTGRQLRQRLGNTAVYVVPRELGWQATEYGLEFVVQRIVEAGGVIAEAGEAATAGLGEPNVGAGLFVLRLAWGGYQWWQASETTQEVRSIRVEYLLLKAKKEVSEPDEH